LKTRILVLLAAALSVAWGDIVTLKSGRSVEGTFLGGDSRSIRVLVGEKVETLDVGEISMIQFGSAPVAAAIPALPPPAAASSAPAVPAAPVSNTPTVAAAAVPSTPVTPAVEAPAPATRTVSVERAKVEVPAGSAVVVRMIDDVDSKRDAIGKTYRASIDEAVQVNAETVIPRGADVVIKLVDAKKSGTFTGKTELSLDIVTVTVNGKPVDIPTDEVSEASKSQTTGTAKKVGGLAAVGAVIGGIAGGGTGAAIGAAAGAGTGAGWQVITRGQQVKIPSEARLSFRTSAPVRI
jgi:hypothetical protein